MGGVWELGRVEGWMDFEVWDWILRSGMGLGGNKIMINVFVFVTGTTSEI
jgi:hypothetical protein